MSLRTLACSWSLVTVLSLLACGGGDDDAPPPGATTKGGKGGKSGGAGKSGAGQGGSSAGGSSQGGSSQGGSSQGGSSQGGSSQGGSAQGGTAQGGSNQGGGFPVGGSSQGGSSAQGGSGGTVVCSSSQDCAGLPVPICNLQTKQCVDCLTNADCAGNLDGARCDPKSNRCVECLSNTDCGADPDRVVCDVTFGRCVECLVNADCATHPDGPRCNSEERNCTCTVNSECAQSSKGKLCDVDGLRRCGECITAFDCPNPALPGCTLDDKCFKGDFCSGDDAEETGDDGPLGALDLTPPPLIDDETGFPVPPPWSKKLEQRHVCDLPVEESDWYRFSVNNGDRYDLTVDWAEPDVDLDLIVQDSQGRLLGYDYHGRPARVRLTYLPAGTMYAYVYRSGEFDKLSTTPTVYSIKSEVLPGTKCLTASDCGDDYDHQFLRGQCIPFSGECRFIDGQGKRGQGSSCDSDKDCEAGRCSYQPFTREAPSRSFCTVQCETDPCPDGQRCATYLLPDICLAPCQVDDDCHVELSEEPSEPGKPWQHLSCNPETGNCE